MFTFENCVFLRYSLKPPSNSMIASFVEKSFSSLSDDKSNKEKITPKFLEKFKNLSEEMSHTKRWNTACHLIAKKLVRDNLALRRKLVGELLNIIRAIGQQLINDDSFEGGSHTVSSEPYYRDTAYKSPASRKVTIIDRENKCLATKVATHIDANEFSLEGILIAVDNNGRCYLNMEHGNDTEVSSKIWKYDVTYKTFCSEEKQAIIDLTNVFTEESVKMLGLYCKI